MERLFIHKVSRFLLPSSSCSCHAKNISDVVENSMTTTSRNLHETAPPKNPNKHKKAAAFLLGLSPAAINEGRRCPPVTPISVVDSHLEVSNNSSNGGWFSSEEVEQEQEEEGETDDDTFFSLSSTSSRSFTHPKTPRRSESDLQVEFDYYYSSNLWSDRRRKTSKAGRKKRTSRQRKGKTTMMSSEMGYYDAIEKSTNDPYNDFRTSMVEMIVAKQIFGAEDLQRLLHCFLSFNSSYFHRIIVEVFSEIIETLFSQ
ncbi:PREDICTED: transcription repressor OFP8-like [Ipomoea nil]|uniref:transcription repressor OFP8-like n=1 Tax=Ipomoea nil TaxID=35883 RepID=UPI000900D8E5|nr:PREDICTED: transcription repressor OFP8-like [Ipomoea nil]